MYYFGWYYIKNEEVWGYVGIDGGARYARKTNQPRVAPGGGYRFFSEPSPPPPPTGKEPDEDYHQIPTEIHLARLKQVNAFKCAEGWLFTCVSNEKLYRRGTFQLAIDILTKDVLEFGYGRSEKISVGVERAEIAAAMASVFPHLDGDLEGQIDLLSSIQRLRDEVNFRGDYWDCVEKILAKMAPKGKQEIDPRDLSS